MEDQPVVEIYSIGTELLNGQIQDTNSFWVAQQIAAIGGYVRRVCILDDNLEELISVFTDSCTRGSNVLITTGGLGPTPDDMTVEAVARIKGEEVVIDEQLVHRFMENRDIQRREDLSEGLIKMAMRPKRSIVYPNPAGVAPCIETSMGKSTIYNFPGPPREVQALFSEFIEPLLAQRFSRSRVTKRVMVNLPESVCGPILQDVMNCHPNTYLKAFVSLSKLTEGGQQLPVDVVAWAKDELKAKELLEEALHSFVESASKQGSDVQQISD